MILPVKLPGLKRWWESNEAVTRRPPAGISHKTLENVKERKGWVEAKKLIRYSIQLSMLKQLYDKKLITENEYLLFRNKLMKDYNVVSDITA